MENKTALTQYLDWLAELKKCDQTLSSVLSLMESKATELRDTVEKEQIIKAAAYGNGRANVEDKVSFGEYFYNQTYKP